MNSSPLWDRRPRCEARHPEQLPAFWSGGPLESSALVSQMGTPRPQGGRGAEVSLSPPLPPTSWGSWVPSPGVTCKLSSRPKTMGTGWAQGPVRGAGTDGARRVRVLWTFATTLAPRPALCSLQRHLRAALRPAVHPTCPVSVKASMESPGHGPLPPAHQCLQGTTPLTSDHRLRSLCRLSRVFPLVICVLYFMSLFLLRVFWMYEPKNLGIRWHLMYPFAFPSHSHIDQHVDPQIYLVIRLRFFYIFAVQEHVGTWE